MARPLFLLGAGASAEAGVPITLEMSRLIIEALERGATRRESEIARFVLAGLIYSRGRRGEKNLEAVDVEELYATVEALAERSRNRLAPFISSWVAEIEDFDVVQAPRSAFAIGNLVKEIDELVRRLMAGRPPSSRLTLERRFEEAVRAAVGGRAKSGMFNRTANAIVQQLRQLAWLEDPLKVEYLDPLSRLASGGGLVIASLNYDNCVELTMSKNGVGVWRGIEEWSTSRALNPPPGGVALLKLHGSIDWVAISARSRNEAPLPHKIIRPASQEEMARFGYRPAVVFGQDNKLTAEGPFLELLRIFNDALAKTNEIAVIGYSFRDEHVNEYLRRWINGSRDRRMRIVDRRFAPISEFGRHLADFCADRLDIVESPASEFFASLSP